MIAMAMAIVYEWSLSKLSSKRNKLRQFHQKQIIYKYCPKLMEWNLPLKYKILNFLRYTITNQFKKSKSDQNLY